VSYDTSALGPGFLAAGVALLLVGGAMAVFIQANLASEPARATGTVVDIVQHSSRYGWSAYPLVQFTTAGGETDQVQSWLPALPGLPGHVGEEVTVAYDPAHPGRAAIDSFAESWIVPLVVAGLGLIALLLGLAVPLFTGPGTKANQAA